MRINPISDLILLAIVLIHWIIDSRSVSSLLISIGFGLFWRIYSKILHKNNNESSRETIISNLKKGLIVLFVIFLLGFIVMKLADKSVGTHVLFQLFLIWAFAIDPYFTWQPKSKVALNSCMKLFLEAKDGSRAKARWRKMLLKNFDTDEDKYYDNPQNWLMITNSAVLSSEESEQEMAEITDLIFEVELSEAAMQELAELIDRIERSKEANWDMKIYPGPLVLEKAILILRNKVENYFARQ